MSTSTTPKIVNKIRHCDTSPVFFTGLAKTVKTDNKLLYLCTKCGSGISNIWINDRVTKNYCTDCENFLDEDEKNHNEGNLNLHKANLSPISKTLKSTSKHTNSESAVLPDNCGTLSQGVKRKVLLPSPGSVSNCDGAPKLNENVAHSLMHENYEKTLDNHHVMPSPVRLVEKRKHDFYNGPIKKNRFEPSSTTRSLDSSDDKLSRSIWSLFMDNKQTKEVFEKKMALRNQLHNILLKRFPSCGLYVVGSSMTGLGANSSDMDMCLMLTDSEIDQAKEATSILRIVRRIFQRRNFLRDIELIYAKVPILKFRDSVSGIEVDLNINNAIGIRNTQLLTSYARLDKRLPPLVVLAKLWARSHGINDAKHNSLSSYSLVLMVIHYLQYGCQPPVLPSLQKLQPDKFEIDSDVRKLKLYEDLPLFTSENEENVGDLFIGFLKYYANEFDYDSSVISIRLGCVLPREAAMNNTSPRNKVAHWKYLCIEEPFDLTNTARAVFNLDVFHHIRQVFIESWNGLKNNKDLYSIFN